MDRICQSCAMPMAPEFYGTKADGTECSEYCIYCCENGKFTQNLTMDEMIEHNLEYIEEWKESSGMDMTVEEARAQLKEYMPTLKRWK